MPRVKRGVTARARHKKVTEVTCLGVFEGRRIGGTIEVPLGILDNLVE